LCVAAYTRRQVFALVYIRVCPAGGEGRSAEQPSPSDQAKLQRRSVARVRTGARRVTEWWVSVDETLFHSCR
jgi:hypothetical protein